MILHSTNRNVFLELGFCPQEAKYLKDKATVFAKIIEYIKQNPLPPVAIAKQLNIELEGIHEILQGKQSFFSLKQLNKILENSHPKNRTDNNHQCKTFICRNLL